MTEPLRIEARFKNARLFNLIFEDQQRFQESSRYGPVAAFCRRYQLNHFAVGGLLTLKRSPLMAQHRGPVPSPKIVRPVAARLAEIFGVDVWWLFPPDLYDIQWTNVAIEVPMAPFLQLRDVPIADRLLMPPQESKSDAAELRSLLADKLATLTNREQRVLRERFGLDGEDERTLEEIGHELGITRERVRCIEVRALQKMRHPKGSRDLRPYLDPV